MVVPNSISFFGDTGSGMVVVSRSLMASTSMSIPLLDTDGTVHSFSPFAYHLHHTTLPLINVFCFWRW